MRTRQHILELQAQGRKEEIAPYLAQTMKEEGAFEREAGGAYSMAAILKQRYWGIEQSATFIEQGMKAEEEAAKNTQKMAEAKKKAGEVAERQAEFETKQAQIWKDFMQKVEEVQKKFGTWAAESILKPIAHPEMNKRPSGTKTPFERTLETLGMPGAAERVQEYREEHGPFVGGKTPDEAYSELAARNRDKIRRGAGAVRRWLHFDEGGTVPGAAGEEVPIMAHGQETIIPADYRSAALSESRQPIPRR